MQETSFLYFWEVIHINLCYDVHYQKSWLDHHDTSTDFLPSVHKNQLFCFKIFKIRSAEISVIIAYNPSGVPRIFLFNLVYYIIIVFGHKMKSESPTFYMWCTFSISRHEFRDFFIISFLKQKHMLSNVPDVRTYLYLTWTLHKVPKCPTQS